MQHGGISWDDRNASSAGIEAKVVAWRRSREVCEAFDQVRPADFSDNLKNPDHISRSDIISSDRVGDNLFEPGDND